MTSIWANVVGVAAATCSMVSFLPQILKILRERDASSVSVRMYLVTITGFACWIVYGVLIGSWPVAASNVISLGMSAAVLVLTLRMDWRNGRAAT